MWCQKTKTGKYQYFERYRDPRTGKLRTTSLVIAGNKRSDMKAAEDALRIRVKELTSLPSVRADLTFGELRTLYIRWQKENLKEQTAVGNDQKLKVIVKCIGSDTLVSSLTAPYIKKALKAEKPTTYNERLKHFKAMMRWAYSEELIGGIDYMEKLKREKVPTAKERDRLKYLEKDELNMLLSKMKQEDWKLFTRFLALSGLRIGEAIALLDDDVDMNSREITVNKTYSLMINKISTTKTETSNRSVFMQDELYECCREIKLRKTKNIWMTGHKSDLFFPTVDGEYIEYYAFNKYFRENTEAVLGRKLTPHALRHTHVALLAENGIPLDVISRRLGHADSAVTRDIYYHVTKKMKEADNQMLKEVKII